MIRVRLRRRDVRRDTFRCGGKGGQNVNKVETGVRYTHLATGIVAEGREERTQGANDTLAWERLEAKLAAFVEARMRAARVAEYEAKATASFGSQIRTYRLLGPEGVLDHRTGHQEADVRGVLNGKLDGLIRAGLRS